MKTFQIVSSSEHSFNYYGLTLITRDGAIVLPAGYLKEEDAIKQGKHYIENGYVDAQGSLWHVYAYNVNWCVMFV